MFVDYYDVPALVAKFGVCASAKDVVLVSGISGFACFPTPAVLGS